MRAVAILISLTTLGCASTEAQRTTAEPERVFRNTLRWKTASEVDNFGFDVYRSESETGPFERVSEHPVQAAGTSDVPREYVWVDTRIDPRRVYYYYVESISMNGARERFTPVIRAEARMPAESP